MFKWLDERWPNWPVRLGALLSAVCAAIQDASVNGTLHKSTIGFIIGMAFVAFFAKRSSVTGGSIPQTGEAVRRAEQVVQPRRAYLTGPARHLVWLLMLALVIPTFTFTGCAAFRSQNPALPSAMVTELNFSNQLFQLQSDYENFFTKVGQARREGVLTQANVDQLNVVGDKVEKVLEHGNAAFKSWEANKGDDALKQAVISAISEGTQLFIELTAQQRALVRAKSGGAH